MGAELSVVGLEIGIDRAWALDRAEQTLDFSDPRVAEAICDYYYPVAAEDYSHDELRNLVLRAINVVYDCWENGNRDCTVMIVDHDRKFLLTGGHSWGDEPSSVWDEFMIVLALQDSRLLWLTP